ncbi:MAG: Fe(3+) dicitrate-binding periplasmic protein [Candidatus Celerinatantimonas neptuna]|nr:MAG: Fe(3+) dicitrate-binding periplasmic protein [Candidatus Celerinatantimonas neptuna]
MSLFSFTSFAGTPRVVALEFSFAEDLVAIGITPVGIADDGRPSQLLPALQNLHIQSVGSRAQPNIEAIAALHPTLIIADKNRHSFITDQLRQIAPTLLLASRRANYTENINAAFQIGKSLGLSQKMRQRIKQHRDLFGHLRQQLIPYQHQPILFMISRGPSIFVHSADSYIGGLLTALGLTPAETGFNDSQPSRQISIEQLLAMNPDRLLLGRYGRYSLSQIWKNDPLWHSLPAVQKHHIYTVNGNIWVKGRGLLSSEIMAKRIVGILVHSS